MFVDVWEWRMEIDESLVVADETEIREQVAEYTVGERKEFDLDVDYPDSFTGRVMTAMAGVPRGETRTYGEIAGELDTAAVAVGQACGRNPVPLVVPCHRIVGANGLGGFSGGDDDRLGLKERLLELESA
ncbi:methylated-DNA--[protein]-cysteine S-methyltransferase [Haladaptatus sp. AB618]|uniref:methylated-DNA--[protein]-cysteine S-methyltransferase n=1 Tax=Haladaptatus sp. AB618 TaxID=2934173 RepID=UPI00209C0DDF|nr:methylated-DNA--[protein]-cysteine S-methyltransferase [Haladaptatus sp. AB618]MCO8256018.1 methylated-DNA--[protein]-cysteine S-methyltransferase [Haladaptatus sp. AB618]